jgi:hypothetical protein
MFKMQMGLAGIGTPDATYAVSCRPTDGTKLNLHWNQPWTRSRRRFLTPRESDRDTCYSYTIQKGDTVGAIVDHFGVDMRQVRPAIVQLQLIGTPKNGLSQQFHCQLEGPTNAACYSKPLSGVVHTCYFL